VRAFFSAISFQVASGISGFQKGAHAGDWVSCAWRLEWDRIQHPGVCFQKSWSWSCAAERAAVERSLAKGNTVSAKSRSCRSIVGCCVGWFNPKAGIGLASKIVVHSEASSDQPGSREPKASHLGRVAELAATSPGLNRVSDWHPECRFPHPRAVGCQPLGIKPGLRSQEIGAPSSTF